MPGTAPRLSLRIDFEAGRLGPGKVELLEHIARERSIAAAARAMQMSYKRAWELVDTMNHMFRQPVVSTLPGRNIAGSTALTAFGRSVIDEYRAIETAARDAAAPSLRRLRRAMKPARAVGRRRVKE
jgi:molybdate transport system regulatory protein